MECKYLQFQISSLLKKNIHEEKNYDIKTLNNKHFQIAVFFFFLYCSLS